MDETYRISFQVSRREQFLLHARSWFWSREGLIFFGIWIVFTTMFIGIIVELYAWQTEHEHDDFFLTRWMYYAYVSLWLVTPIYVICFLVNVYRYVVQDVYNQTRPIEYEISPDGVRLSAHGFRTRFDWACFDYAVYNRHVLVCGFDDEGVTVYRKYLPQGFDWDTFCSFCEREVNLARAHAEL